MNLQELKDKLPAEAAGLVDLYGPTILLMTAEQLREWLNYVFVGRYTEAYALYLKAASADTLLAEWDTTHAEWKAANDVNADKIAMSQKIGQVFAQVMIGMILAVVGF